MEPIDVQVTHFRHGSVIVRACGRTEAICRAAVVWGCSFTEIMEGARVALRQEDLARLRSMTAPAAARDG